MTPTRRVQAQSHRYKSGFLINLSYWTELDAETWVTLQCWTLLQLLSCCLQSCLDLRHDGRNLLLLLLTAIMTFKALQSLHILLADGVEPTPGSLQSGCLF